MFPKKPLFTTFHPVIYTLILCCCFSLQAQIDSLQSKSYEELIQLYDANLYSNPTNAETYALASNIVALKNNDQEKIGVALYSIATSKYYLGKFEEAISYADKSLNIATAEKNNSLFFKNYNLKGNIYSDSKKEFVALDQYLLAKKYADLTNDPLNQIVVSNNIAFVKKNHKDHEEAIILFKENLDLLQNIKTPSSKKDTYEKQILFNLADTYLRIHDPNEAAKYNALGIQKCDEQQSPLFYYSFLMNDAIINYQNKNYEKTIELSKKAAIYFLSIANEDQLVTPYFYIGKSYFQQKLYKDGIHYLEKTNDIISRKNIAYSDQKDGYEILYQSYKELNDTENATKNLNLYIALDKKTDSIDISVKGKIHNDHHIIPLQEEIDSLDTNNQKQRKKSRYLIGISIALLASLIGFFIWFKRKQQQNKIRFQQLLVTIKKLEQPKEKVTSEIVVKENANPVTDENALLILKALETFEEKEYYLRQDCTLGYVAKKVKTNTSYLSNVINSFKEKSFKSYLSELRINAALIKLKNDEKLRSYTIKAISDEFGFKRSETFSRAFKAQTGMYPSYYIKSLENQKDI